MKNKILVFVVALIVTAFFNINKLSAQTFSPSANNKGYIYIDSYNSKEYNYIMEFFLGMNGKIEYENWSLQVRAKNPIMNDGGNSIELASIFSIRLRNINNAPFLEQNAIDKKFKPLKFENIDIIQKSVTPLSVDQRQYKQYIFDFDILVSDILVAGESYLSTKISENKYYHLDLIFSVYGYKNGVKILEPLAVAEARVDVKNYPNNGNPPPGVINFGFEVNANASLDFTSPEHYTRQVENDLSNSWVKVTSKNSGYVIKVKTNTPNFELIRNDSGVSGDTTIPVNVVNVEMQSAGSGASQGAKPLSSTVDAQTLFIGTKNKNTQKLPVRYFIRKTEAEKLATKTSGEYKAILTYTLEPN